MIKAVKIPPPKTPMCDKLAQRNIDMRAVAEFMEWASAQGLEFARFHKHSKHCYAKHEHHDGCNIFRSVPCNQKEDRVCGYSEENLEPHRERAQAMVMRWLEIDESKLERERDAILDHHRKVTDQVR